MLGQGVETTGKSGSYEHLRQVRGDSPVSGGGGSVGKAARRPVKHLARLGVWCGYCGQGGTSLAPREVLHPFKRSHWVDLEWRDSATSLLERARALELGPLGAGALSKVVHRVLVGRPVPL